MTEPPRVPRAAPWLLPSAVAWLLALLLLRYGFMEIPAEDDPCLRDAAGAACAVRGWLGLGIHLQVFGNVALVLALAAHLPIGAARRVLAVGGVFAALLALVLYNVQFGAPAAVIAVLALADQGLVPRRSPRGGRISP